MEDPGSSDEEINQEKPEHHCANIRARSPLTKNKHATSPLCSHNNVPADVASTLNAASCCSETSRNDGVIGNCKSVATPSEEPHVLEGNNRSQLELYGNNACAGVGSLEGATLDVFHDVSLEEHSTSVCTDIASPALHKNISCDAVTSDIAGENSDRRADARTRTSRTDSSSSANLLKDIFNFFQGAADNKRAGDELGNHAITLSTSSSKNDTNSPHNGVERNPRIELTNQTNERVDSQSLGPSSISIHSSVPADEATAGNFVLCGNRNCPEANECNMDSIPNKGLEEVGFTSGRTNGIDDPIFRETVKLDSVDKKASSSCENPSEDDLLAELENEFFSTADIRTSVSSSVECFPEYNALNNKFNALQRRLEHTLTQRKELEVENARLEQKLAAAVKHTDAVKLEVRIICKKIQFVFI